jgi:hypothetical protein
MTALRWIATQFLVPWNTTRLLLKPMNALAHGADRLPDRSRLRLIPAMALGRLMVKPREERIYNTRITVRLSPRC